jgi:two-component sensor histidine kinase
VTNTFRFLEHRNLQLATSRASISLPVILGTALISALTHLFGSGDLGLSEAGYRIAAAALSVVPMFVVLLLAQLTRPKRVRLGVAYVLLGYLIGGSLRGVALAALLSLSPEISEGGLLFRVPTSLITMTSSVAILTFAWATYSSHREAIAALTLETNQLRETLRRLDQENQARDLKDVARVAAEIVAELKRIELYPAREQVAEIRRLVDEQVRPLSRKHALDLQQWSPAPVVTRRQSFRKTWLELNPVTRFPSFWFLVPLSLTTVPAVFAEFGLVEAIEIAVYSLASLSIALYLGGKVAKVILPKLRSPAREFVFTLLLFLIATPGVIATYLALLNTPRPGTYVIIGLISFPLFSWVLTLGSALLSDLENRRGELAKIEAELRWAIARVNLLSWYNRGVVTRLLHGPIQNSMHVSLIKLQNAGSSGKVDRVIRELADRVQEAQAISETDSRGRPDIAELLTESEALWAEIADASLEFDDSVANALANDIAAGGIVLDACNEQFSNAIRHGRANRVRIELSLEPRADQASPALIKLLVEHNGSTQSQPTAPSLRGSTDTSALATAGLGTKFLANCSVRFETTRADEISRTEIYLPLVR